MRNKYNSRLRNVVKVNFRQRLLKQRLIIVGAVALVAVSAFLFLNNRDSRANEDGSNLLPLDISAICSNTPNVNRRWIIYNPNNTDIPFEWRILQHSQSGLMIARPGNNFLVTNTIRGLNPLQIRWQNEHGEWMELMRTSITDVCPVSGCFVSEVVDFKQTKRNDGSVIPVSLSDPSKALGPVDESIQNYVALGFGGEITLKFEQAIANGAGPDIKVFENTPANLVCGRYPERIMAFASQDGCNFVFLGEGCQDAEFDLQSLEWAQYIKLIDISPLNAAYNNEVADGYDLEGVACLNGYASNTTPSNMIPGSPQRVVNYSPGRRKNGTPVHSSRTNPQMALGVPSMDDLGISFVALGFYGSITLKFDYAVFNLEGNDLMVVETSFGAPNCETYPEEAYFEGSLDGINWTPLGTVCLDGTLDLAGMKAIHYIRVTDRSPMTFFPNSADGYDLDGIMVINANCGAAMQRRTFHDRNDIPDEVVEATVFPNPFKDSFSIEYEPTGMSGIATFRLYNYLGQEVISEKFQLEGSSAFRQTIQANHLTRGAYIGSLDFMGQKQSIKLIKN